MKRTFSTMFVVAAVALSAVSTTSARHWDGDAGPALEQQSMQPLAPAKHHKKIAKKVNQDPYYHGPH